MVTVAVGSTKPIIRITSGAGRSVSHFLWPGGRLVAWGWTDALELAILEDTGKVGRASFEAPLLRLVVIAGR